MDEPDKLSVVVHFYFWICLKMNFTNSMTELRSSSLELKIKFSLVWEIFHRMVAANAFFMNSNFSFIPLTMRYLLTSENAGKYSN